MAPLPTARSIHNMKHFASQEDFVFAFKQQKLQSQHFIQQEH